MELKKRTLHRDANLSEYGGMEPAKTAPIQRPAEPIQNRPVEPGRAPEKTSHKPILIGLVCGAAIAILVILLVVMNSGEKPVNTQTSVETTSSPTVTTAPTASPEVTTTSEASSTGDNSIITFKQGIDAEYPPYTYFGDSGEPAGFDVELAQAVCDYNGWEYEAISFNWDNKDSELAAGICDCIWSGFSTNGREDDYLWSLPYLEIKQVIVVKEDSGIESMDDLAGRSVGVVVWTDAYDALSDEQIESIIDFNSSEDAFNALQTGRIDAFAVDGETANYLIQDTAGYRMIDLSTEQYAVAFRKEDTELCEKVNEALKALADNGTYDAIGQKYPEVYDYLSLNK